MAEEGDKVEMATTQEKTDPLDEPSAPPDPSDEKTVESTSSVTSAPTSRALSANQIGLQEDGSQFPGFVDVVDEFLSFTSESDFTIFNRQIASDIPLQRVEHHQTGGFVGYA